jgi:tryptophan synthase alpha chain
MNRLIATTAELKKSGRKALVGYLTAGYPDADATVEIAGLFAKNGVDVIELGIPFSDPVADGPTIQAASQYALEQGIDLAKIFDIVTRIRRITDVPLVFMSYMNPLIKGGCEKNIRAAHDHGVDGFVIPDLIPEEAEELQAACKKNDMAMVFLVAPNTPVSRMREIDRTSEGFVYVVSLTGVTGSRDALSQNLRQYLGDAQKNITANPRYLGFGISKPEHIGQVKRYVDGVIVGSAFINIMRENRSRTVRNKKLVQLVRSLRNAL